MSTSPSPAAHLRSLMNAGVVAAPGSFNALCARAVADAGFTATYVSGAAASVCAGVPDVGLLTLEHFCRLIREVHSASNLPLIADADTGFGEAEMVRRTVIEYHRAGAAGLHLEDQQFPKRCGHLDGKALVSTDHMVEKIQWAANAARDLNHDFIICARTDARGVEGLDSALTRATAYVNAGAEMIFPEGLTTEAEFADFATRLRAATSPSPGPTGGGGESSSRRGSPYLLANMTEFGKTPLIPLSRFGELGYDYVIYPVSLLRVAMGAVTTALHSLRAEGTVQPFLNTMQTRQQLYALINYTPGTPWQTPAR
jgi:methylisocitrate lyase